MTGSPARAGAAGISVAAPTAAARGARRRMEAPGEPCRARIGHYSARLDAKPTSSPSSTSRPLPGASSATYRARMAAPVLHVTNGDAVVPEIAEAAGVPPDEILVWLEILHDGPVPAGLGPAELARVRARHLAARGWSNGDGAEPSEETALAAFRERDARLAAHPGGAEVALWFEDDLFDWLLLAQLEDRLAGRSGPVSRVYLRHPPRGDVRAAFEARERIEPDPEPFAALRSPDPRAWLEVTSFQRLLEDLPDVRTGLTRTE